MFCILITVISKSSEVVGKVVKENIKVIEIYYIVNYRVKHQHLWTKGKFVAEYYFLLYTCFIDSN